MKDRDVIDLIERTLLVGRGQSVILRYTGGWNLLECEPEFIELCLKEIRSLVMCKHAGISEPSALETLAIKVLLSAAGIDKKTIKRMEGET